MSPAAEPGSTWSARSAARTNEVDAGEGWGRIGDEEMDSGMGGLGGVVPGLVLGRREVAERGMASPAAVEDLDVFEDVPAGFIARPPVPSADQLGFQGSEKALHERVVVGISDRSPGGHGARLAAPPAGGPAGGQRSVGGG